MTKHDSLLASLQCLCAALYPGTSPAPSALTSDKVVVSLADLEVAAAAAAVTVADSDDTTEASADSCQTSVLCEPQSPRRLPQLGALYTRLASPGRQEQSPPPPPPPLQRLQPGDLAEARAVFAGEDCRPSGFAIAAGKADVRVSATLCYYAPPLALKHVNC